MEKKEQKETLSTAYHVLAIHKSLFSLAPSIKKQSRPEEDVSMHSLYVSREKWEPGYWLCNQTSMYTPEHLCQLFYMYSCTSLGFGWLTRKLAFLHYSWSQCKAFKWTAIWWSGARGHSSASFSQCMVNCIESYAELLYVPCMLAQQTKCSLCTDGTHDVWEELHMQVPLKRGEVE